MCVRLAIATDNNKLETTINSADVRSDVRRERPNTIGPVVSRLPVEDHLTAGACSRTSIGRQRRRTACPLPNFSLLERCDVARVDGDAILEGRMIPWGTISVVEKRRDGLATVVDLLAWNDAYVNGTRRARCQ